MSIRQYIGARYVTKIYENSLDPSSAEWEASVNYEPLTLVTYNYGSYLSKKTVPASIGNPADNPSYWAQTGFYNGQIASLQSQINDIIANMPAANNKPTKLLCIGDSYGTGVSDNWASDLKDYIGLDNDHFTKTCVSGSGFVGNPADDDFYTQLTSVADIDTYTHIVFAGGFNDAYRSDGTYASYSDIRNAIVQCATYINTNAPDAKVYIGFISNVTNYGAPATAAQIRGYMYAVRDAYSWIGAKCGWCVMKDASFALHDYNNFDTGTVVYGCVFHPNSTGSERIAQCIYSYIMGGDFIYNNNLACTVTASGRSTSITGLTYIENQMNEDLVATFSDAIYAVSGIDNTNIKQVHELGTIDHQLVFPNDDYTLFSLVAGNIILTDDSSIRFTGQLLLKANKLYIYIIASDTFTGTLKQIETFTSRMVTNTYMN